MTYQPLVSAFVSGLALLAGAATGRTAPAVQPELDVIDAYLQGEFYRSGKDPAPVTDAALNLANMGPEAAAAIPQLVRLLGSRIDTDVAADKLALFFPDNLFVATIDGKTVVAGAIQLSAVAALARIGPAAIEPLREALKSDDEDMAYGAAFALVMMKDPLATKAVTEAINDSALKQRSRLAAALGYSKDAASIATLAELAASTSADLRDGAIRGLGNSKDRRAAMPLIAALKDSSASVRFHAADGLWFLAQAGALESSALEPLVAATADPDAGVRSNAAKALGELKDRRAIGPLIALLGDSESSVRYQASLALRQATGQNLGEDRAPWEKWWQRQNPRP
jgi:HEAT repeat protein